LSSDLFQRWPGTLAWHILWSLDIMELSWELSFKIMKLESLLHNYTSAIINQCIVREPNTFSDLHIIKNITEQWCTQDRLSNWNKDLWNIVFIILKSIRQVQYQSVGMFSFSQNLCEIYLSDVRFTKHVISCKYIINNYNFISCNLL